MEGEFYKTKASVKAYIESAKDVSGVALIDKLKTFLPAQSTLLEIGSGPGTDYSILTKSYDVVGSDNSEVFLKHLITTRPSGNFCKIDAVDLVTDKKFDGIYSNKVLHHLKDDELVVSIIRQLDILNTNGVVCHSFWLGKGSELFKGLFVNYHTKLELRKLFEEAFEIIVLDEYQEFEEGDSLLLIGRKK